MSNVWGWNFTRVSWHPFLSIVHQLQMAKLANTQADKALNGRPRIMHCYEKRSFSAMQDLKHPSGLKPLEVGVSCHSRTSVRIPFTLISLPFFASRNACLFAITLISGWLTPNLAATSY